MAAKRKFDIENPTDEMIENLQASEPGEEGFHITKLSERDSKLLIEMLTNPPAMSDTAKENWRKAKNSREEWFGPRKP